MGNKQLKMKKPTAAERKIIEAKSKQTYQNKNKFIPLFTTKTSTTVYGYCRSQFNDQNINQIMPIDIIEMIYLFTKNNCSFIIIFENDKPEHSYLHEMDVESGTNKNLSIKYSHNHDNDNNDPIWTRVPGAAYCYGQYNEQNAIYRIGKTAKSIACILRAKQVVELPEIDTLYCQTLYCKNRGLFVIGGCQDDQKTEADEYDYGQALNTMWFFSESVNAWIPKNPMKYRRCGHLSLYYESHQYGVSDKIFSLGGINPDTVPNWGPRRSIEGIRTMESYDFDRDCWNELTIGLSDSTIQMALNGGCIDYESNCIIVGGGRHKESFVHRGDLTKNYWTQIGDNTNFTHIFYPKIAKNNGVIVIFGNKGYSKGRKDYGYVEFYDERSSDTRWVVLSSLREMLEFDGHQVRNGFYQHMIQI